MITPKEMVAYLYFVECKQDNNLVMEMISNHIKPKLNNNEIKEVVARNPKWISDYVCISDNDYPEECKQLIAVDLSFLFYPKAKEKEMIAKYK